MLDLEYVLISLLLVYAVACLPWWSAHPENSLEVRDLFEREKSYNDQLTEFEKSTGVPLDPDSRQYPRAKCKYCVLESSFRLPQRLFLPMLQCTPFWALAGLAENEDMVRTHPKVDEDMRSAMMMVIRGYKNQRGACQVEGSTGGTRSSASVKYEPGENFCLELFQPFFSMIGAASLVLLL